MPHMVDQFFFVSGGVRGEPLSGQERACPRPDSRKQNIVLGQLAGIEHIALSHMREANLTFALAICP